jgi:hypothetical protein
VSKHIQTAAHSAKEAESGDSRGTDYADATPAREYSGKPENGKNYFALETAITLNKVRGNLTAEALRRRDSLLRWPAVSLARFKELSLGNNTQDEILSLISLRLRRLCG